MRFKGIRKTEIPKMVDAISAIIDMIRFTVIILLDLVIYQICIAIFSINLYYKLNLIRVKNPHNAIEKIPIALCGLKFNFYFITLGK